MNDKVYPIGTVVQINDENGPLIMVGGYFPKDNRTEKHYDYFGVVYPIGLVDLSQYVCFNASAVHSVVFEGYKNEDGLQFVDSMTNFRNKLSFSENHLIEN